MLSFLTAFPTLQDLDLRQVTLKSLSTWPPITKAGHTLRSLNLSGENLDIILKYFTENTRLVQSLSSLRIRARSLESERWTMFMAAIPCASLADLDCTITDFNKGSWTNFVLYCVAQYELLRPQIFLDLNT